MRRLWFVVMAIVLQTPGAVRPSCRPDFPALKGPYLGQTPPGMIPEIFAPGLISTGQYEFGGSFSPDGSEFFFSRRPDYEGSGNRIFHTRIVNGVWTEPALAPFAKDIFEFLPVVTPDGGKLFFYSERAKPGTARSDGNLWYCLRTPDGWGEARFFESPVNREYCMTVSSTKSGTLYFAGVFNQKRGIFRSPFEAGGSSELERLPDQINALGGAAHPFIAADESYLVFDAQAGGMGRPELFISFRNRDGSWSKPQNMGPEVNATKTEFAASVSPDGKYLFFHRRVRGNGDLYWVSAKIIEDLRPQK